MMKFGNLRSFREKTCKANRVKSSSRLVSPGLIVEDFSLDKSWCLIPPTFFENNIRVQKYSFSDSPSSVRVKLFESIYSSVKSLTEHLSDYSIFSLQSFSVLVNESTLAEQFCFDREISSQGKKLDFIVHEEFLDAPIPLSFSLALLKLIKNTLYLFSFFIKSGRYFSHKDIEFQKGSYAYEINHQNYGRKTYFFNEIASDLCVAGTLPMKLLNDDIGYKFNRRHKVNKSDLNLSSFLAPYDFFLILRDYFHILRHTKKVLSHCDRSLMPYVLQDIFSTGLITNLCYFRAFKNLFIRIENQKLEGVRILLPFEGKVIEKMALLAKQKCVDQSVKVDLISVYPLSQKHWALHADHPFWKFLHLEFNVFTIPQSNVPALNEFGWKKVVVLSHSEVNANIVVKKKFVERLRSRILISLTMSDKCNFHLFSKLQNDFRWLCDNFDVRIRPHPYSGKEWVGKLNYISDQWDNSGKNKLTDDLIWADFLIFGDNSVSYSSLALSITRVYCKDTLLASSNRIEFSSDAFIEIDVFFERLYRLR